MDSVDLRIIKRLMENSQLPFTEIAKELGISSDTVRRRFQKMKKEKIIQRATIRVDLKTCGFQGSMLLLVKTNAGVNLDKFFDKFANMRNVIVVSQMVGDYDFSVLCVISSMADVAYFQNKLKEMDEIKECDLSISTEFLLTSHSSFPNLEFYNKSISNIKW
jgi:Lrp/AsnC family transcriptional regulator for asnA, asnC and gidA